MTQATRNMEEALAFWIYVASNGNQKAIRLLSLFASQAVSAAIQARANVAFYGELRTDADSDPKLEVLER